jgi:hypothetical protein
MSSRIAPNYRLSESPKGVDAGPKESISRAWCLRETLCLRKTWWRIDNGIIVVGAWPTLWIRLVAAKSDIGPTH